MIDWEVIGRRKYQSQRLGVERKMEEEVDMIENGVHSKLESSGLAMQPLIALIITKALV